MFNNNQNFNSPYYQEFKVQNSVEDKTKAENEEDRIDKLFRECMVKFSKMDDAYKKEQQIDKELDIDLNKVKLEDSKFNIELQRSKEENEKKLNGVVFKPKTEITYEEEIAQLEKNFEKNKKANAREMEKLKVKSLVSKIFYNKGKEKIRESNDQIKKQTAEEIQKEKIKAEEVIRELKENGALNKQEQEYFGNVDIEKTKQAYDNKFAYFNGNI